jgi:hypothetical protein
MAGLSDDEFVGYIFTGVPERRPRLWFLDRHLEQVFLAERWPIGDARWPIDELDLGAWTLNPVEGKVFTLGHLRYEHYGTDEWTTVKWSAVWRLTDTTIPRDPADARRGFGVETFGRDDDVWRLGVWPD